MKEYKRLRREENLIKYAHLIDFDLSISASSNDLTDKTPGKDTNKRKTTRKKLAEYRKRAKDITNQANKPIIEGYDPSMIFRFKKHGCLTDNPDKLVIDHKIPIIYGFKNNIPPENIGHISNLQYISIKDNLLKGIKPKIDDHNKWIIE